MFIGMGVGYLIGNFMGGAAIGMGVGFLSKLFFKTKEQAINWAQKNNYQFYVEEPKIKKIKPQSYASNFDINRKEPWTH